MAGQNGASLTSPSSSSAAAAAGMYNGGMNGAVLPSAGQYADMQLLMQNMETLSGYMQQNREEWTRVQEGLERVERMRGRMANGNQGQGGEPLAVGNGEDGSGEVQAPDPPSDLAQPSVAQLQNSLAVANNRILSLEETRTDHLRLQHAYEESLAEATDRIRHYAFEQQNYIASLQQSYVAIINSQRQEIGEVQRTHYEWQASLGRLNEGLRGAMGAREAEGKPWKRRIAGLKMENAVLRRKVGWEPAPESDEDEDGEDEEGRAGSGMGGERELLEGKLRPQVGVEERRALQVEREAVLNGLRESQDKMRREGDGVGQG